MSDRSAERVLTVPNALSFLRILSVPIVVVLVLDRDTTRVGIVLFGVVAATDWLDGWIARRSNQVTELGKLLDPTADRLAIVACLVALVARGVFPAWAATPILVRDLGILVAGGVLLSARGTRIDVRFVGKAATFSLMAAIGFVSWGNLGMPLPRAFLALGWVAYGIGLVEYAIATAAYVMDLRRSFAA
jgi:cardiolipin synthase